jgi:hypothetical protein
MSLWFIRIKRVDIPRDRRGFVASWLLGSGLGIFALTEGAGWLGGVPAFIAALAGIFFCALVYISPQKVADDAVRVGERLRGPYATSAIAWVAIAPIPGSAHDTSVPTEK